jgi:hypothetical protein
MIVQAPRTLEEFTSVKKTINEMLASKYCTCQMKTKLTLKLTRVNEEINKLTHGNL